MKIGRKEGGKVIAMDERKGGTEGRWMREGKEIEKRMQMKERRRKGIKMYERKN